MRAQCSYISTSFWATTFSGNNLLRLDFGKREIGIRLSIRSRAMTGDLCDMDAVKKPAATGALFREVLFSRSPVPTTWLCFGGDRERMSVPYATRACPGVPRERPVHNDAGPVFRVHDLIRLHADKRVGAHPVDFLSNGGECIEVIIVVRKIDRHDVRLGSLNARQSPCSCWWP